MTKHNFLRNSLSRKELTWGTRYLLFQFVFLPRLLNALNWALGAPLSAAMSNLLYFSINFIAVLVIFRQYLLQFFTLEWEDIGRIAAIAVIFFGIYEAASWCIGWLLMQIQPQFFNINDQNVAALTDQNFLIMFLGTVILVPVAEETFFRGLLFRGLYDRSPAAAWITSTAVFSLIHIINYIGVYPAATLALCFVQYLPAGICLAAAYRLSGSIITPIAIHTAVNLLGILALR